MGNFKDNTEDFIINSWMAFIYIAIAIAVILGLIQCGHNTYRDMCNLNRVDTIIIRDTIEIHDTVVNGYRDINAIRDTLNIVYNKINLIDFEAKHIDPFNDEPKHVASKILILRNNILEIKNLSNNKRKKLHNL